jgi:hypothetical protein
MTKRIDLSNRPTEPRPEPVIDSVLKGLALLTLVAVVAAVTGGIFWLAVTIWTNALSKM